MPDVTQVVDMASEHPDEANTTAEARDPDTEALEQTSAVLAAPTASGLRYLLAFTNLPAGEWQIVHKSSTGEKLGWGYVTVTLTDGTFKVYGARAAELPSTAVAVAAVKADTENLLSRVTSTVATLWANLTAMISGSLGTAAFTETALANAPAGGGGGVDNSAQLTRIENQTSLITAGSIQVVSPVTPGGDITLTIGDDYLGTEVVPLAVSDAGETLKTFLEAATSVIFGGGRGVDFNQVTGTVDNTAITHVAETNTTTIPIAIASVPGRAGTDYTYHIKAIVAGKEHTKVKGNLTLESERARPTT